MKHRDDIWNPFYQCRINKKYVDQLPLQKNSDFTE